MSDVIILDERRPKPPAEGRAVTCEIMAYDNGDVTVWLGNEIMHADQFNWLFAKLAGATGALFDEKRTRTASE